MKIIVSAAFLFIGMKWCQTWILIQH